MTFSCKFLVSCLWFCLVVGRSYYETAECPVIDDDVNNLLCANERCLTGGNRLSAAFLTLRRLSHLRPLCKRRQLYVPFSYWLLLIAGDVELNPGPIKYPCTVCNRPVKRNQRGIQCDSCDLWTHANCCSMSVDEYKQLGDSDTNWICPTCLSSELPYANSSITSDASFYPYLISTFSLHEGVTFSIHSLSHTGSAVIYLVPPTTGA